MMQSVKVYRLMAYLQANAVELPFDTMDLKEKGVTEVLQQMDLFVSLLPFEEQMLRRELHRLCWQAEVAEMVRLAAMEQIGSEFPQSI